MKLTRALLKECGFDETELGTFLEVPSFFKNKVDLLAISDKEVVAFMSHRYFNDYRIMASVMIVLNQLVRYYKRPVILYCLSYRFVACGEKIFLTFKKYPNGWEN